MTLTRREAGEICFRADAHFAVIMLTPQPGREVMLATDHRSVFSAPVGTTEIIPAGADFFARWRTSKENILLGLEPDTIAQLADTELGLGAIEFLPLANATVDPTSHHLARLLGDALTMPAMGTRLYAEALVTALSIHLLRMQSIWQGWLTSPRAPPRGALPVQKLRQVDEYMRAHIADDIRLPELAAIAGMSAGHFLRAFRAATGQPPHQYLMDLRLDCAELLIRKSDAPLQMVAALAGFSSQSHLTAVMRRRRFATPGGFRQTTRLLDCR